jgi:hypothetical protein
MDRHDSPEGRDARRQFLVGTLALAASGCFGSFGATNALYDWNVEVSDSKWLRWLVFLVLIILPVYGLFILADALVINTIEFFSGKNPVSGSQVGLKDGSTLHSSRTKDPNLVRHEHRKDGEVVRVLYVRRVSEGELHLLDGQQQLLAKALRRADGAFELFDARGKRLSVVAADKLPAISRALQAGKTPTQAVLENVEDSGLQLALADSSVRG